MPRNSQQSLARPTDLPDRTPTNHRCIIHSIHKHEEMTHAAPGCHQQQISNWTATGPACGLFLFDGFTFLARPLRWEINAANSPRENYKRHSNDTTHSMSRRANSVQNMAQTAAKQQPNVLFVATCPCSQEIGLCCYALTTLRASTYSQPPQVLATHCQAATRPALLDRRDAARLVRRGHTPCILPSLLAQRSCPTTASHMTHQSAPHDNQTSTGSCRDPYSSEAKNLNWASLN